MGHITQYLDSCSIVNYIYITCTDPEVTRGFSLTEIIEELESNTPPVIACLPGCKLVPLALDNEAILHPVFENQDIPEMKLCKNPAMYSSERMLLENAADYYPLIDICIIDAASELMVTRLVHTAEEFDPKSWEVCEILCFYYPILPELISIMKQIPKMKLEDFYATAE